MSTFVALHCCLSWTSLFSKHFQSFSSFRPGSSAFSLTLPNCGVHDIQSDSPLPCSSQCDRHYPSLPRKDACLACNRPSQNVCRWILSDQSPTPWPHHAWNLSTPLTSSSHHQIRSRTWTLIDTWKCSISPISNPRPGLLTVISSSFLLSTAAHLD